jgi:hypothetical protein
MSDAKLFPKLFIGRIDYTGKQVKTSFAVLALSLSPQNLFAPLTNFQKVRGDSDSIPPTETDAELLTHSANNGYENRPKEYGYEECCSRGAYHRVAEKLYPEITQNAESSSLGVLRSLFSPRNSRFHRRWPSTLVSTETLGVAR